MKHIRKYIAIGTGLAIGFTGLVATPANAYDADELVLTFKIPEGGYGSICIPLGTYETTNGNQGNMDLQIDWGTDADGYERHVFDGSTLSVGDDVSIIYDDDGDSNSAAVYLYKDDLADDATYTVKIKPNADNGLTQFGTREFYRDGDNDVFTDGTNDCRWNLKSVEAWGNWVTEWPYAFDRAKNLTSVPNSTPGNNPTLMTGMFHEAESFNSPIGSWDVSNVEIMNEMFQDAKAFNRPIGDWDVSNVTDMSEMFENAEDFDKPIGAWDVSNVTTMYQMFKEANDFNEPIGDWDVSSVTNMRAMFEDAYDFNQPIGDWDVSKVTTMHEMFNYASDFNQPIGDWDVSSVTTMYEMFNYASVFNEPIGDWDVSKVTNMEEMFFEAHDFNQPLNDWDVSNVTTMAGMFNAEYDNDTYDPNAESESDFNQDLNSWDVGKVEDMSKMFYKAKSFNGNISSWNTAKVADFGQMFRGATVFNTYVGNWNTESASSGDMANMFTDSAFNFCLPDSFFISGETYSDIGLSGLDVSNCVTFVGPSANPYYGPIVRPLMAKEAVAGEEVVIPGYRMNTVETVTANGVEFEIVSKDMSSLTVVVPESLGNVVSLTLDWVNDDKSGSYRVQQALNVTPVETTGGSADERRVNAGSFKGYVAVYAKGYEGSRLSAKIGNDWVIVDSIVNNQENGTLHRTVDFTGAGVDILVRIYIDRVLMRTIPLTTK